MEFIVCSDCSLTFENKKLYANHVRWHHKTPDRRKAFEGHWQAQHAEAMEKYAVSKTGRLIKETVSCPTCGTPFERQYRELRPEKAKKCCSRKCANGREWTPEKKAKASASVKKWQTENPEKDAEARRKIALKETNLRFSSKAERALAEALKPYGFHRHHQVRTPDGLRFDVDIASDDGKIWVESDGEWHFRKVHKNHDFERTRLRDQVQAFEADRRGVKLIRINNQETSLEEQIKLVLSHV